MIRALDGEKMAIFKSALHVAAAMVIVWYLYRIANGQFSLL
ncbi:MAG: hypothetical protein ABSC42_16730 [Tepidisphaeraceae bacterium]|jgi:hypothetical protein